jgi:hypothetical protein
MLRRVHARLRQSMQVVVDVEPLVHPILVVVDQL